MKKLLSILTVFAFILSLSTVAFANSDCDDGESDESAVEESFFDYDAIVAWKAAQNAPKPAPTPTVIEREVIKEVPVYIEVPVPADDPAERG